MVYLLNVMVLRRGTPDASCLPPLYLESPSAPHKLWEWEQPWIHHLIVNARSFKTTWVKQKYFQDDDDLARENTRIWEAHYRSRPLYDYLETWQRWLGEYRQLIMEVQDLYETHMT